MNPELQRRVQQYGWDKAAPYYDLGWQQQLWPAQERLLVETDLQAGDHVLDLSCGTGLVTLPLADIVTPEGKVTGIDLSEEMIEKARSRTRDTGFENITFRHMDAENLDFEENTFDHVICSLGLMYYPYPEKAMSEMYRVVKPGKKVSALVWGRRKACGWASIFPIVDKRVQSDVCPLFFRLGNGNALQNSFENTGFRSTVSNRFSTNLTFTNDENACVAAFGEELWHWPIKNFMNKHAGRPIANTWILFNLSKRIRDIQFPKNF